MGDRDEHVARGRGRRGDEIRKAKGAEGLAAMDHLSIFRGVVGPVEEQQTAAFVGRRPFSPKRRIGCVIKGLIAPTIFQACERLAAPADESPLVDPSAAVASEGQGPQNQDFRPTISGKRTYRGERPAEKKIEPAASRQIPRLRFRTQSRRDQNDVPPARVHPLAQLSVVLRKVLANRLDSVRLLKAVQIKHDVNVWSLPKSVRNIESGFWRPTGDSEINLHKERQPLRRMHFKLRRPKEFSGFEIFA